MVLDLNPEERAELLSLAAVVATDFLKDQLQAVESKMAKRKAHLERFYARLGAQPPQEDELAKVFAEDELLQADQGERALLQELTQACRAEPLVEVLRRRLQMTRQRSLELSQRILQGNPAARTAYRQTHAGGRERFA